MDKALLYALFGLLLLWVGTCDESVLQVQYDELDDATRVTMPLGGQGSGPVQVEATFACAGDGLCRPDALGFRLTSPWPSCPSEQREWSSVDSLSYNCRADAAALLIESEVLLPVAGLIVHGEGLFEDLLFRLPYEDIRRFASPGVRVELHFDASKISLPLDLGWNLAYLMRKIEEDADPHAKPWDAAVSAWYEEESAITTLRALLPAAPDASPDGPALIDLEGECSGRGWCRDPTLTFHFSVDDSTSLEQNLADVSFVLDDSLLLEPRFVEFRKLGEFGSVTAQVSADALRRIVASSSVKYTLGPHSRYVTGAQLSVLRRFWTRVANAGEPIPQQ